MKGCLKWALYGFGALVVLGVLVNLFGGNQQRTDTTRPAERADAQVEVVTQATFTPTPESTATPVPDPPTATPEWMAPGYQEMCRDNGATTDVQQEVYAESMAGKKIVAWPGEVYDVERDGNSYRVQVDVADGIFFARQVEIEGVDKELAANLNVEQRIIFSGTIKSVDMFAGGICNPIRIIDAKIIPQ